jgi:predicted signal transduction protein with EAL and GGDEF domain
MDLPNWLDAPKIAGLAVLILAVVQYFKVSIPDKYLKCFAMAIGIILAILCELYIGAKIIWVKAILNGAIASILADTAYGFLSKKGGIFTLPSKEPENKPK